MRHGSLFSGGGGFDLSAEWMGWENVFHCEIDNYARKWLKKRWPQAVSYTDAKKTDFSIHRGSVDVLSGGFPCQDASNAHQHGGGQSGLEGVRTGLFWHMLRAMAELRPTYAVGENVAGILKTNGGRDFATILAGIRALGYHAEWRLCYAAEVGAPHKRPRIYLVAYPSSFVKERHESFFSLFQNPPTPERRTINGTTVEINAAGHWLDQSPVPFLDDGVPKNMAGRFGIAGNAVVPQLVMQIFKTIEVYEHRANNQE
jgi:DNA-cytosine methyltransferase